MENTLAKINQSEMVRLSATERQYAKLLGYKEVISASLADLTKSIGDAKYRISIKPQVEDILTELQRTNHQRSVGMYESLLTQVMQEVLPNESKSIAMSLGIKAGSPSLDITVERGNGRKEDILAGNGGSLTNVICAGLRFIALSRTTLRKFIVLDESDCWLPPARVAAFANVAAQMGSDLGVQSLMISHHDIHLFAPCASSIVSITKEKDATGDEFIEAHYVYDLKNAPQLGQIEFIRLVNFMSHSDTTIPLSAGMTAIIGDGDVGKSAIVAAISALSGIKAFKKEYVKHGAASASVFMGLVGGDLIECTRYAKGSKTVVYQMTNAAGDVLHKTETGEPLWLQDALGIRTEGGLDIQVGDQKSPIFLLDESDTKQASILSIGRESSLISSMQAEYKKDMAEDRQIVKAGEEQVLDLRRKLSILELLSDEKSCIARAALNANEELVDGYSKLASISDLLAKTKGGKIALASLDHIRAPQKVELHDLEWISLNMPVMQAGCDLPAAIAATPTSAPLLDVSLDIGKMSKLFSLPVAGQLEFKNPCCPKITHGGQELSEIIARMKEVSATKDLVVSKTPAIPYLGDAGADLISRLTISSRSKGGLLVPAMPSHQELTDAAVIGDTGRSLQSAKKVVSALLGSLDSMQVEASNLNEERSLIVESIGGVCPLCHGSLTTQNKLEGHNHD